jgi:hypothetical protein
VSLDSERDDTAMLDLHVDGWWQRIAVRVGLWLIGLTEPR